MKRQGRQAESFCKAPDPDTAAVLMFGRPGAPLDEHADLLIRNWQSAASQPLDIKRVTFDDIRHDPALLVDELFAASLFGGASLFVATLARETEAAPFLSALTEIDSRKELPEGRMLLLAGDLTTKSKLRKAFEDAKHGTALQFYERTAREFETWVRDWLAQEKIRIEPDALHALVTALQEDPALAASELSKLALFAADKETPLTISDVRQLVALEDQSSHFELIDLALDGKLQDLGQHLPRLAAEASAIPVLIGLVNQLKRLSLAHDIAAQGISGPRIGDKLFPRIFERQWPDFDRRMQVWQTPRILALLSRVHEADMACRQAGSAQDAIVAQLLLDIARAGQAGRR